MEKQLIIDFFKKNRLFQDYDCVYDISPQLIEYIDFVSESNNQEDFVILLHGLDDNTGLFEFTHIIIENIQGFFYNFNLKKQIFFSIFLNNINIIYPHAINMTANVLFPILYDDNEARQYLCDALDGVENEKLLVFKEIYLLMIQEDHRYRDECILKKLELVIS